MILWIMSGTFKDSSDVSFILAQLCSVRGLWVLAKFKMDIYVYVRTVLAHASSWHVHERRHGMTNMIWIHGGRTEPTSLCVASNQFTSKL